MDIIALKEKLLKGKLELFRLQTDKDEAARLQNYEKAAGIRDLEKIALEKHLSLKNEISSLIAEFKLQENNLNEYLELNELLFEFHPSEFRNDSENSLNKSSMQACVNQYWQIRQDMYSDFKIFIETEYKSLMLKRGEFIKANNQEASDIALRTLYGMGEFLSDFRRIK